MDFGTPKVTNFLFFWVLKRECPSGSFFVKFGEHDKREREQTQTERELEEKRPIGVQPR